MNPVHSDRESLFIQPFGSLYFDRIKQMIFIPDRPAVSKSKNPIFQFTMVVLCNT